MCVLRSLTPEISRAVGGLSKPSIAQFLRIFNAPGEAPSSNE